MPDNYLHHHKNFPDLLAIVARDKGIQAELVEKDYWIMHVLFGLQKLGFSFELKGGTSLSKAYNIIHRFSEDIDIRIMPPEGIQVAPDPKRTKTAHVQSRLAYYNWLSENISIDGIVAVERDTEFDDERHYRSGGIRLHYKSYTGTVPGLKDGILLEAGFDAVTPNQNVDISSWAYDKAAETSAITMLDNRAVAVRCYNPGYTFVEKLQTIATKFRQEQESGEARANLMRQYYDVACLLDNRQVQEFIGTSAYEQHKADRFPKADLEVPLHMNQAFLLDDKTLRSSYTSRYAATATLYYNGQPDFEVLLERIKRDIHRL